MQIHKDVSSPCAEKCQFIMHRSESLSVFHISVVHPVCFHVLSASYLPAAVNMLNLFVANQQTPFKKNAILWDLLHDEKL